MANGDYIYNETLSGTVDGINKEFTTLNNINKLEEVYLGGVAYRSVTFVAGTNVITFADAPPLGGGQPTADYFIAPVPGSAPSGDVTFGDLIEETFDDVLGAEQTSSVFKLATVKRYLNKGLQKIKNEKFFKEKVLSYTFNKAKDVHAIGFDASTIDIGEKDFIPATGAILLSKSAFVEYSSYTGGILGAAAGFTYKSGDDIVIGYKIPSGVKKVAEVIIDGTPMTYRDPREYTRNRHNEYSIFHASNGDRFIFMPFSDELIVTVRFITDHVIYVDDSDIVDILYEYTEVVTLYAAYKTALNREDDRWQALKQEYREEKDRLKAFKARQVEGVNNRIKTQPFIGSRRVARTVRFSADVTGL